MPTARNSCTSLSNLNRDTAAATTTPVASPTTSPAAAVASPSVSKGASLVFNVSQTFNQLMKRVPPVGSASVSPRKHSNGSPSSSFVGSPASTTSSTRAPGRQGTFTDPTSPVEAGHGPQDDRRFSVFTQGDDDDDEDGGGGSGLHSDTEDDEPEPLPSGQPSSSRQPKNRGKSVVGLFSKGLRFIGSRDDAEDDEEEEEAGDEEDEDADNEPKTEQSRNDLMSLLTTNDAPQPPSHGTAVQTPFTRNHSRGAPSGGHSAGDAGAAKGSQKMRRDTVARSAPRTSDAGPLVDFSQRGSLYSLNRDPSMYSMGSRKSLLMSTAERQKNARERRAQLHQSTRLDRERELEGSRARLECAAERKAVIVNQALTQRHWAWAALVYMSRFCNALMKQSHDAIRRKRLRDALIPKTLLIARRWLRRTRLRRLLPSAVKPKATEFRNDRTLNLFSDAHLEYLVAHLELRYYFTNETIIFMGSEDDECFVMCRGAADVLVGHTTVSHINQAGIVFGSVGMISGEPRTASIVARVPSLVWVCTRSKFEAFGMTDNRVQDALAIIADLRQNNLRAVYRRYISTSYLATFHPLRELAITCIDAILGGAGPLVAKQGVSLVQPFNLLNTGTHRCYLLLRGTIKIFYQASGAATVPLSPSSAAVGTSSTTTRTVQQHYDALLSPSAARAKKKPCARELVQRLIQFPLRGARVTFMEETKEDSAGASTIHPALAHLDDAAQLAAIEDGGLVATVKGPLLLNVPSLVLNDALPFRVETGGGCDLLYMTRSQFMSMDPVDIDNVRRGCYDMRREFVTPLPLKSLRTAMCRGALSAAAFPFLKRLDTPTAKITQQPMVYPPGAPLYFDPEHGMYAHIVLSGQLQGVGPHGDGSTPLFWPDLHMVYFGSVNAKAIALTRLDVLRISRKDVVDWFVTQLHLNDMESYVAAMKQVFETALHRVPYFSFDGIEASTVGGGSSAMRADGLRRKKSILALHRTANFNVTAESADEYRASQHRSLNAALVYQEATDGQRQDDVHHQKKPTAAERTLRTLQKLRALEDAASDNNHRQQVDDGDGVRVGTDDRRGSSLLQEAGTAAAAPHSAQRENDHSLISDARTANSTAGTDLHDDEAHDALFLDFVAGGIVGRGHKPRGSVARTVAPQTSSSLLDDEDDGDDDDYDDVDHNESIAVGLYVAKGHHQDQQEHSNTTFSTSAAHTPSASANYLTSFLSIGLSKDGTDGSLISSKGPTSPQPPEHNQQAAMPTPSVPSPHTSPQPPSTRRPTAAPTSLGPGRTHVVHRTNSIAPMDPLRTLAEFEIIGARPSGSSDAPLINLLVPDAFGGGSSRRFSTASASGLMGASLGASTKRNPMQESSCGNSGRVLNGSGNVFTHLDRSQTQHHTVVVNRRSGLPQPKATATSLDASTHAASVPTRHSALNSDAQPNTNQSTTPAKPSPIRPPDALAASAHLPRSPQLAPSTSPRTPLCASGHHGGVLPARHACVSLTKPSPAVIVIQPTSSAPTSGRPTSPTTQRQGHRTAVPKSSTVMHNSSSSGSNGGRGGNTLHTLVDSIRTSTATSATQQQRVAAVPATAMLLSASLRQPPCDEEPRVQYLPTKLPRPKTTTATATERMTMRLRNHVHP